MIEVFEDYVNWWPVWYRAVTILFGFGCGITFFQSLADGPRFGTGYYGNKARKAFVGLVLCLALLWPAPLIVFLFRLPFRWSKSELDEIKDYERRAYSKKGLDYDFEMRKRRRSEQKAEDAERHARWEEERAYEDEQWEREQLKIQAQEAEARFGEQYFGGR